MWLNDWSKFHDTITRPLPITSSLFLLGTTSFLLLASDPVLAKLGLTHTVTEYRWLVSLGSIIGATWVVVTALILIAKHCYQAWSTWQTNEKLRQRLHNLTADERRILSGYISDDVRSQTFHGAGDLGTAEGLAEVRILYKPDVDDDGAAVVYNIQEWALNHLRKNKHLVAPVVPSDSPSDWFARIPAWLAIVLTAISLYITYRSYKTAMKSAEAARQSADAAVASLRPWIKINNIELRHGIGPAKTLMFHWPTTGAAEISPMLQTRVTFVNEGHSVAQDVEVWSELFFGQFVTDKWLDTVTREQARFCKSVADRRPTGAAGIVYPSDSSELNMGVGGTIQDADIVQAIPVAASLIACVNYRGTALTRYQTQAWSGLLEDNSVFIKPGVDADASRLKLIRQENGDHAN
jgi:hypothetical protein